MTLRRHSSSFRGTHAAVLCAPLALAALCAAGASAHEADWNEPKVSPSRQPAPAPPASSTSESPEDWVDPYAQERRWGPVHVGASGGYFAPWQGSGGPQVGVSALVSTPSGRFRIGGELLYRGYETTVFRARGVEMDSYEFNAMFVWVILPDAPITPYLGAALGLHLNKADQRDIETGNPALIVRDTTGLGYGVSGILGLELALSEHLALFAEGRAEFAVQITGLRPSTGEAWLDYYDARVTHTRTEDTGGGSGTIGMRVRF